MKKRKKMSTLYRGGRVFKPNEMKKVFIQMQIHCKRNSSIVKIMAQLPTKVANWTQANISLYGKLFESLFAIHTHTHTHKENFNHKPSYQMM